MKKIFSILAVALVAFSFASCNGNNPTPGKGGKFAILVENITATGADVTITPTDTAAYYYWNVFYAESVKEAGDSLSIYLAENLKAQYGSYDWSLVSSILLTKGEENYTFTDLPSETDLAVVAFYLDSTYTVLGEVGIKEFTTPKMEIAETVALNFTSATVNLSYLESYGIVGLSGEAQDGYDLELFFYADELNGTFTEDDFYSDGQYVYNYVEWGDGDEDWTPLAKMNLVGALNEEGTEYAFSGSVVGSNAVEYTFNAIATIAAEEEEGGEDAAFAPKRVVKKAALKESAKKRASLK